ncbi:hypothetical protein [Laceyella putida]|uniref:Uncharacterized protein n=1 Tax=Laceyella putida TaxID=110101 RepID=A0ABW2RGH1_9BACL
MSSCRALNKQAGFHRLRIGYDDDRKEAGLVTTPCFEWSRYGLHLI